METAAANRTAAEVAEGDLLWTPSELFRSRANVTTFISWLSAHRGVHIDGYQALWHWSVTDLDAFWAAIWAYFEVISDTGYSAVVTGDAMPNHRWFPGSKVNYAEHILRHEPPAGSDRTVFHHSSEIRPLAQLSWRAFADQVRRVATALRGLGVRPGDRVVSYMPNVPETAVAMLATAAIGAVWSAASPEFGAKSVIERFAQIEPKVIFAADGYVFGGNRFDRREEIEAIVRGLPSLQAVIWLPYLGGLGGLDSATPVVPYDALLAGEAVDPEHFRFERVPNNHPLWVLFSSGTTGIPKAIAHTHVGVLVEHLKLTAFHINLKPESCLFFYTTTGWMMWNFVIAGLLTGAAAVLYDGSPVHPGSDRLWRMADTARVTHFGASPTLVQMMKRDGVRPVDFMDTSALEAILLGGAPASPEVFQWFYTDVKTDLWVTSVSGGTELCSALVGGVPIQPVFAGEIQARALGIHVQVWDDRGCEIVDEVGELVVLQPFPSMPAFFWGDTRNRRYLETYYSTFAGVWRHGDLTRLNARGGCYIYGRSDATLNRYGVRIGSAEIYRVVEDIAGVRDSLVVCCDLPGGDHYMPLFVALEPGTALDAELLATIRTRLRLEASPRHVPDDIHAVASIPYTLTGKKMEVPIRRILMGARPDTAASRDAMSNPESLAWFDEFSARPEVAATRGVR